MTLACNICPLILLPRLLWERRRAKPLIAGSVLSQAGGDAKNRNWLWSPPRLATVTAEPARKGGRCSRIIYFMRWTVYPLPLVRKCKCKLSFTLSAMGNFDLMYPLSTRFRRPSVSLKTNLETLMGFQGWPRSVVTFQKWAGQDISRCRLRVVEACPGPLTHKSAHTWPYRWDPALRQGTAPQRKHQQQTRILATETSLLEPFIESWHYEIEHPREMQLSRAGMSPLTYDSIF